MTICSTASVIETPAYIEARRRRQELARRIEASDWESVQERDALCAEWHRLTMAHDLYGWPT